MKRIVLLIVAIMSAPAWAVSTSYWTASTEADFNSGTLDKVVATSLSELKLARALTTLMDEDPRISTVNKLIQAPDGTLYAGTGPSGVLLKIKDKKVTTAATIPDATDILSLAFDSDGKLLLGTGGEAGKIYRLDKPGDKPKEIFSADGVQYIWALVTASDGNIYAATGPTGKLFVIKPDGTSKVLFDCNENNLLSMVSNGKDLLYVGTDPHGLVYRINRQSGQSFVLYNTAEDEVTALSLDQNGNLFAATGEVREGPQQPEQSAPSSGDKGGRPDGTQTGVPIPSNPPQPPQKPQPPVPNPGVPHPIPNAQSLLNFNRSPRFCQEIPGGGDGPNDPGAGGSGGGGSGQILKSHPDAGTGGADATTQPSADTGSGTDQRAPGNAVYKIDPEGFVTEVFREQVQVLAMVARNGTLLIATGPDGQIYQVDPDAEENIALVKVDAKQVTALLPGSDGEVYVGMANTGSIAAMSDGYASNGVFLSPVLDATQISRFGKMQLNGSLPPGTSILVSTRSGNVKETSEKDWSPWTPDVPARNFLPVTSGSARFLQYRLTLQTTDASQSPVVDDVSIAYQMPNLAPQIHAVHLVAGSATDSPPGGQAAAAGPQGLPSGGPGAQQGVGMQTSPTGPTTPDARRVEPSPMVNVTWDATDPNNDPLTYTLYFRRGQDAPWILLRDDLTDNNFQWDTRTVADGRYQIKVVASDAAANAPGQGKSATRVSDPIVVDNTPPDIGDIQWKAAGNKVHIQLTAADQSSTVAAVEYILDSGKDWQLVLPVGSIYDSPTEDVVFDLTGLSAGTHQVTLRATDSKGNQSLQTVFVKVGEKAPAR